MCGQSIGSVFPSSCRPVYVSAVRPQSKHIVVMVDHGASVTDTQLQIARDSALVILNAIDEHDKVGGRGLTALTLLLPEDLNLRYFHPPASNSWIYCPTFSRSPSCRWQRRFALVLWTSATRVCSLRPPARPRGRWAPSSLTSRPPTEPPSTQRASRRPSSCSETPAASPNRAPVRKYCSGISCWHWMFGMCSVVRCASGSSSWS